MVRTKTRIAPEAIYVSWQAFAVGSHVIPLGTRLRGSHEAVQLCPQDFVPDGTPMDERPTGFEASIAELDRQAAEDTPPPTPPRIDPQTPLRDLLICATEIIDSTAGGCIAGRIVLRTDPLVAAAPSCFLPLQDRT